jgi:hypothetical protein
MRTRIFCISVIVVICASVAMAAPKVETLPAFSGQGASEAVRAALATQGYRVSGANDKVLAEIWFAKTLNAKAGTGTAIYEMKDSTFAGVITFPNGANDYRGQKIAAGTYTMRYQLLPSDGNHMGVSPDPDFVLLSPIGMDADPAAKFTYDNLVKLSANAAGTNHPAVFAMASPDAKLPSITTNSKGDTVFSAKANDAAGADLPIAIILEHQEQ